MLIANWQSFIIIGHFIEAKPEECWQMIIGLGNSNDEDTRTVVATVLLEYYFEKTPNLFDAKFREYKQLVKAEHKNLLRTLSLCTSAWGSETNQAKVNRFLEKQICSV